MYNEFILRDGEIAFNMPDGTVTIMNVNTYLQLQKALKEQEEKEEGPSFFEVAVGLLLLAGAAADPEDPSDPEPENKKILTDESFKKWARLPENKDKVDVDNKPKVEEYTIKNRVPDYAVPGDCPASNYVYVADDGKIFRSAAEVEEYYGLAKNSVSAYFADKQKYLYKNKERVPSARLGLDRADCSRLWVNTPAVVKCKSAVLTLNESYRRYKEMVNNAIRWKNA